MPLADYDIYDKTGKYLYTLEDELFKSRPPETIKVTKNGLEFTGKKVTTVPARTPERWGDCTGKYGVNGVYDIGLGMRVQNEKHRDKILKQRGLVRESEAGNHFISDWTERKKEEKIKEQEFDNRYMSAIQAGKTPEQAVVEAAPAHEILGK